MRSELAAATAPASGGQAGLRHPQGGAVPPRAERLQVRMEWVRIPALPCLALVIPSSHTRFPQTAPPHLVVCDLWMSQVLGIGGQCPPYSVFMRLGRVAKHLRWLLSRPGPLSVKWILLPAQPCEGGLV